LAKQNEAKFFEIYNRIGHEPNSSSYSHPAVRRLLFSLKGIC